MNGYINEVSNITGNINETLNLSGTIKDDELKGSISEENKIRGVISAGLSVIGALSQTNSLIATLDTKTITYPLYDGEYIIIPGLEEQILNTKDRVTKENIEVKEIPYSETSNEYGYTITIA